MTVPIREEKELIELAIHGDKLAFASLMIKYQSRISNIVSRYAINQAEILDISQESFLKAYKAIAQFRGDSSFYTWLYRIAVNTAKNNISKRKMRFIDLDVNAVNIAKSHVQFQSGDVKAPEDLLIKEELEVMLSQAIDYLPEKLRTPFILFEHEGHSYIEIAQIMNCPIGTIRSRLHRARRKLELHISS